MTINTAQEPLPRARLVDENGFLTREWRNFLEGNKRQNGELLSGFASLGWGATATEADASNAYVGAGTNSLLQPLFNVVSGYWSATATVSETSTTSEAGGVPYFQSQMTGTPASGANTIIYTSYPENSLPVQAGQRIGARALLGAVNLSEIQLAISWYNSAGTNFQDSVLESVTSPTLAGAGGVSAYQELSGVIDAPATAVYARFYVRGYANGSASPTLRVARPLLAILPAGQQTAPPWSIGFPAVPGADPTINTLPVNVSTRMGAVFDPVFPLSSSSSSSISVAATTITRPGGTVTTGSATLSGLSTATIYSVFYDTQTSSFIALDSGTASYYASIARYIAFGTQATQDGGGGYPSPPAPPGGGGGGGFNGDYEP